MKITGLALTLLLVGSATASAQGLCEGYGSVRMDRTLTRVCERARVQEAVDRLTESEVDRENRQDRERADNALEDRRNAKWAERCKPFKRRDANGIDRFEYAFPDCGAAVVTQAR